MQIQLNHKQSEFKSSSYLRLRSTSVYLANIFAYIYKKYALYESVIMIATINRLSLALRSTILSDLKDSV